MNDTMIPLMDDPAARAQQDGPAADDAAEAARIFAARDPAMTLRLQAQVVEAVSTVYDPEIPVNIYELGLIYDIAADASSAVAIRMTLTAPGCPAAQSLPLEVRRRVAEIPGVARASVEVVWDPPWDRDKMSDVAKLQLGLM